MNDLAQFTADQLAQRHKELRTRYDAYCARNLRLDMTRGKPGSDQLDLANDMFGIPGSDDVKASDGTDVRNYGGLDGLPEMKALFGCILNVPADQVIISGNSSLQLMHDTVVRALLHGVLGSRGPWSGQRPKFLCPVPGYDRHFAVCQHYGIEMINVSLGDDGPDMAQVERLVANDASIKGIWCVPKYSNPTGITYSSATVHRLATMPVAAPDFRIFWDNAYVVHDLYDATDPLDDILPACAQAGNADRVYLFGSTSKISFAGAGVAGMAASAANIADIKKHLAFQTIGPDKINQLRHCRYFKDINGVRAHMRKHAALIRPKFEAVISTFERELGGKGIATWTHPRGGYFVSLDTQEGCASDVVRRADVAGVKLTAAGATFPYGKDPQNRNIRIAPTLPPLEQVSLAMEVVCCCVELASVERLRAGNA
jgi:DNA-binding transcriptional MocR family regulator